MMILKPDREVPASIIIHGMAVTSLLALTVEILRRGDLARLRAEVEKDAHWPRFCSLVREGLVRPDTWLQGAVGRCVLGWAKSASGVAMPCEWCSTQNFAPSLAQPLSCLRCGHRADLPRILCDCALCRAHEQQTRRKETSEKKEASPC